MVGADLLLDLGGGTEFDRLRGVNYHVRMAGRGMGVSTPASASVSYGYPSDGPTVGSSPTITFTLLSPLPLWHHRAKTIGF